MGDDSSNSFSTDTSSFSRNSDPPTQRLHGSPSPVSSNPNAPKYPSSTSTRCQSTPTKYHKQSVPTRYRCYYLSTLNRGNACSTCSTRFCAHSASSDCLQS